MEESSRQNRIRIHHELAAAKRDGVAQVSLRLDPPTLREKVHTFFFSEAAHNISRTKSYGFGRVTFGPSFFAVAARGQSRGRPPGSLAVLGRSRCSGFLPYDPAKWNG